MNDGSRKVRADQPGGGKRWVNWGLRSNGAWSKLPKGRAGLGWDGTGASGADRLKSNAQHRVKWRWPREVRSRGEARGLAA